MDHLELVRIHDTGTELVVRTPDGTQYLLALDATLKRAVKTPHPTPAPPVDEAAPLAPREIQARIRGGATAAEVAESSGTPLENVLRYEGPVLAERDYIARKATDIEVSAPLAHEGYRAAFGDEPASLGEMVRTRLRSFGVDAASLVWDAWKLDSGTWRVVARFEVPEGAAAIGEEPPAEWTFHPARRHLENANRWGQVLSEWEPWDVLPTQRRLVPVDDRPFDVDAADALAGPTDTDPSPTRGREPQDDGLLDVLTRRRGTRVGEDADGDDALAHMIARSHQEREAGHGSTWKRDSAWQAPRETEGSSADAEGATEDAAASPQPGTSAGTAASEQGTSDKSAPAKSAPAGEKRPGLWGQRGKGGQQPPEAESGPGRTDGLRAPDGLDRAWPPLRRVPDPIPATRHNETVLADDEADSQRGHKKRRSQVPSWDEIVFGRSAKGEDEEEPEA